MKNNSFTYSVSMRPMASLFLAAIVLTGVAGCSEAPKESSAQAAISQENASAKMVGLGSAQMEKFLSYGQTEALKNMLGGARGIFIAPDIRGEAAFLGTENGTGFLMRRHGKDWSDPIFFTLSQYSLGYQGGAKESHTMILLMTDEAVDQFVKGKMDLGGTGGFAVGTIGMGASGAGGIKGGLELLVVSTNEGIFFGGGMSAMSPTAATKINADIYGKDANITDILAGSGGKYAPAITVRSKLSQMVLEAWNNPSH